MSFEQLPIIVPISTLLKEAALQTARREAAESSPTNWVTQEDSDTNFTPLCTPIDPPFPTWRPWEEDWHKRAATARRKYRRGIGAGEWQIMARRSCREPMQQRTEQVKIPTYEELMAPIQAFNLPMKQELEEEDEDVGDCTSPLPPLQATTPPTAPSKRHQAHHPKTTTKSNIVRRRLTYTYSETSNDSRIQSPFQMKKTSNIAKRRIIYSEDSRTLSQISMDSTDDLRLDWTETTTEEYSAIPFPTSSMISPRTSTPLIPATPSEADQAEERLPHTPAMSNETLSISRHVPLADYTAVHNDSAGVWGDNTDVISLKPVEAKVIEVIDLSDSSDQDTNNFDSGAGVELDEVKITEEWQWRTSNVNGGQRVKLLTFINISG